MTVLVKQSKSASSSSRAIQKRRPDAPHIDHPYVFSVSQIETFLTCPRKWAFDKIDGIEPPANKWAELGQKVHSVLEAYLERGVPIDSGTRVGSIAMPGIQYLPYPRTPGMRIEKWFAIVFGVAAYRGLKDVELILGGEIPLVLDHKTTRSWDWKKSKRELLSDIQAGMYAADAMRKTGAEEVALRWLYYRTEGAPLAEPVDVTINRAQVSNILSFTDHTAKRMIRVIQTCSKAMDVEPDYTGCSAYGGCPHREERCKPKAVKVLRAIMAQKKKENDRRKNKEKSTDDFLKSLQARKEKSTGKKTQRRSDVIQVDDVEEADVINSGDREVAERPGPPPAKQVGNEWIQPIWDEEAWDWYFPEGTEEKEKAQMAKKKTKSKKKKKKGSGSRRSASDILAGVKSKKKKKKDTKKDKRRREEEEEEEPEDEEEEGDEEEEEDEGDEEEEEAEEEEGSEADELMDRFADLLADKIADRLK